MNKRRIGTFKITRDFLLQPDNRALQIVFANMIILEARHNFRDDCVEYVATSDLFEPVEEHFCAPAYEILFTRHGTSEQHLSIKAKKIRDDDFKPIRPETFKQRISRIAKQITSFFNQSRN